MGLRSGAGDRDQGHPRRAGVGTYSGADTGRGMVGDALPEHRGLEAWATTGMGLWTASGQRLGDTIPGTNQSVRWAADMTTQIVNGAFEVTRRWTTGSADGC